MEMKIPAIAITAVVVVIVLAGVLMPVLDDAKHSMDETYSNEAIYSYGKIYDFNEDSDDMVVISVCKTGERSISINGVSHNISAWQPVVMSDAFTIRYYSANMNFVTPTAGSKTITEATITISNGIATFSNVLNTSGVEISIDPEPITWAFLHDNDGDWAGMITESGVEVYAHKNEIYTSNWLTTTSSYFSSKAGTGVVTIVGSDDTTTADINWGGEYLDNGVYKLSLNSDSDDYTFVVDNDGEDYTVHPFLVCVPKTVVGVPDDVSPAFSIFGAIPVLIVIALLVSVVAVIFRSRQF